MTPYVKDVVVDCLNAEVVADFWSRLLGRPVDVDVEGRTSYLDREGTSPPG